MIGERHGVDKRTAGSVAIISHAGEGSTKKTGLTLRSGYQKRELSSMNDLTRFRGTCHNDGNSFARSKLQCTAELSETDARNNTGSNRRYNCTPLHFMYIHSSMKTCLEDTIVSSQEFKSQFWNVAVTVTTSTEFPTHALPNSSRQTIRAVRSRRDLFTDNKLYIPPSCPLKVHHPKRYTCNISTPYTSMTLSTARLSHVPERCTVRTGPRRTSPARGSAPGRQPQFARADLTAPAILLAPPCLPILLHPRHEQLHISFTRAPNDGERKRGRGGVGGRRTGINFCLTKLLSSRSIEMNTCILRLCNMRSWPDGPTPEWVG